MSLRAPIVTNATDGNLSYFEVKNGVQLEIPIYNNAERGDLLTFYWGGEFCGEHFIDSMNEFPLIYDVLNNFPPACLYDGVHKIYYTITDQAQNKSTSDILTIIISTNL